MASFKAPFVRSPYNYNGDDVSRETGLFCDDASLTVQAEAEDADINTIVRRFGLTGQLPQNVHIPMSGDFVGASDYHSSLNALIAADEAFMQMPADVRARFGHDAGKLIEFCEDPANRAEAEKLGIVVPAIVPAGAASDASSASGTPSA